MKPFILRDRIMKISNNRGVALVAVVLVFVFLSILTTSVVAMVYSDNMFSQADENQKKAYYAARSAITVVERAIKDQLEELKDLKDILKDKEQDHHSDPSDEARLAWEAARDDYETKLAYIRGTVLPTSAIGVLTHDVSISSADFETASNDFTVTVEFLSDEEFRLESSAEVNGQVKTVARLLNIKDEDYTSSINLSQMIGLFDNAIFVQENLKIKNNTKVSGDVSYPPGGFQYAQPIEFVGPGSLKERTGSVTLPTPEEFLHETSSYSGVSGTLPAKTKQDFDNLNKGNITPAANGAYSGKVTLKNTTLNFNAAAGDIIMQFDSVSMDNNTTINVNPGGKTVVLHFSFLEVPGNQTKINVKENGTLIIYLEDAGEFKNNIKFSCETNEAEAYIIISETANMKDKNNFAGNHLYIYAPLSEIDIKNNAVIDGAIISKTLTSDSGSGMTIRYRPPRKNIQIAETNEGGTILSLQTHSLSFGINSRWLKE
jgi:hypothetical protein